MVVLTDKSKLHFQPLLFDGFKYRSPNSTYQDHYKGRLRRHYSSVTRAYDALSQAAKSAALSQPRGRKPINFVEHNKNLYKKQYKVAVFDDDAYAEEYWKSSVQAKNVQNIMVVNDDNYVKKNYQHVNVNLVNHSKPFFVW